QSHMPQLQHAKRVDEVVLCFMIEKFRAVEAIEEICSIPGVDMVQFGPSDYCMSRGWNRSEHNDDVKIAEKKVIRAALDHGVQPRCEIPTVEAAKYYIDLGVRHFCLGDQTAKLRSFWIEDGARIRELADSL
ncbi:MAG: aldolase/citrate lyase family protein, partial [Clostridia bacterium]|nr:aldolase/citrate lyase family protein [Clostridia bacterium]